MTRYPTQMAMDNRFGTTRVTTSKACTHRRMIEEVLLRGGEKSGQVRCLECKAIFPDPSHKNDVSAIGGLRIRD